ncbi:MAG: STAS/SEC14 domain-containing protein [Betaproteobacteria bacterium]|nr:STAS/SEC14 domain-containing protein [Betaproteobacteria bacterium]MBV9361303.1 STAS/SEC14 domain-containing protein [Betaproteobacteria bacterium]
MLEHNLDAHGILHLHPKGSLEKEDFAALAKTVDPYIERQGDLAGVIVDAPKFPGWDSLGAMAAHIRFVRDHHKRVKKIAVVTDAKLGDFAEKVGSHFIAATIKHFPAGQTQAAEQWILSKS